MNQNNKKSQNKDSGKSKQGKPANNGRPAGRGAALRAQRRSQEDAHRILKQYETPLPK